MITFAELAIIPIFVEGFLYGKISLLCIFCTLVKEVQLCPGLGVYSGIFAIYLQCASKDSRTTTIVFYALCLLYFLSTATVVGDLVEYIIMVSDNSTNIFFF